MRLAVVVLAHEQPEQVARLLAALRHPRIGAYLHIDRRVPEAPFIRALADTGLGEVVPLPRHATGWGSPGLVDAALEGLASAAGDGCGYFLLISGADFPLRPIEEILTFAGEAGSRSYLGHFSLPDPRWRLGGRDRIEFYSYTVRGRRETCIPRGEDTRFLSHRGRILNELLRARTVLKPARRFPSYVQPFGGSQWWNLSRAAVEHVLDFLDRHPDYRRYHEHTLIPDEIFFQSVLLGTPFAELHEVVDDDLRFMRWPEGGSHPRLLEQEDLPAMLKSEALFARKLGDAPDDPALLALAERVRL